MELNISDVLHCFVYLYMLQDGMLKKMKVVLQHLIADSPMKKD